MKRLVRRKWGWYLVLLNRRNFKVKLLRFKAYGRLSYQYHYHREELWLFLTGKKNGTVMHFKKRELHTYCPSAATYILEIQFGERCDENDIMRIS